MKVLMYEPAGCGGHAFYVMNLSNSLLRQSCEITLLTSSPYEYSQEKYKYIECLIRRNYGRWRLRFQPFIILDRFYRALYNPLMRNYLCKKIKPDMVHLQIVNAGTDQFFVPLLCKNQKVIYTVHNVVPHEKGIGRGRSSFKRIYQTVHHLIVHSNANRNQLISEFGIIPDKISIIPVGTETPGKPLISQIEARERLKLPLTCQLILFFGTIRKNKGLSLLIKSMSLVASANPDIMLLIAGNIPFRSTFDEYTKLIRNLNLQEKVISHIKWIKDDEVELYFRASDIVVLPYTSFASQSNVLLQAYKYHRPVVVTEVGSLGETIDEDETGLKCKLSAESISSAIITLTANRRIYDRFAENMATLVKNKYHWDIVAKKTLEVYKKVLIS